MDDARFVAVMPTADMLVRKTLEVKNGEQVLIIADAESELIIAHAFAAAVRLASAEPTITIMPRREECGCTRMVEEIFKVADVVISVVSGEPVPHSPAFQKALLQDKRLRYLGCTGVTFDGFTKGGATMDPDELYPVTERVAKIMNQGKRIHLTCPLGSDLTGIIEGMPCKAAGGFARKPGELATFPEGEAWQSPRDGTAEGTVIIDTAIAYLGPVSEPIKLTFKKGRLVNMEGGRDVARLNSLIQGKENSDNFAELAVGTNPKCRIIGDIQEVKHGAGRVHVAIGDNRVYGGKTESPVHIDMVISKPTLEVDGKIIVETGRIVV